MMLMLMLPLQLLPLHLLLLLPQQLLLLHLTRLHLLLLHLPHQLLPTNIPNLIILHLPSILELLSSSFIFENLLILLQFIRDVFFREQAAWDQFSEFLQRFFAA